MAAGLGTGLLLAACGGPSASLAQQVRNWAGSAGFGSSTQELSGDLSRLADLSSDSPGARRTACDVLVTDALSANQQLPTPDSPLTNLLSDAYTSAANAGRDCYRGGTGLARSAPEAQAASSALIRAQARYDSLISTLAQSP